MKNGKIIKIQNSLHRGAICETIVNIYAEELWIRVCYEEEKKCFVKIVEEN